MEIKRTNRGLVCRWIRRAFSRPGGSWAMGVGLLVAAGCSADVSELDEQIAQKQLQCGPSTGVQPPPSAGMVTTQGLDGEIRHRSALLLGPNYVLFAREFGCAPPKNVHFTPLNSDQSQRVIDLVTVRPDHLAPADTSPSVIAGSQGCVLDPIASRSDAARFVSTNYDAPPRPATLMLGLLTKRPNPNSLDFSQCAASSGTHGYYQVSIMDSIRPCVTTVASLTVGQGGAGPVPSSFLVMGPRYVQISLHGQPTFGCSDGNQARLATGAQCLALRQECIETKNASSCVAAASACSTEQWWWLEETAPIL